MDQPFTSNTRRNTGAPITATSQTQRSPKGWQEPSSPAKALRELDRLVWKGLSAVLWEASGPGVVACVESWVVSRWLCLRQPQHACPDSAASIDGMASVFTRSALRLSERLCPSHSPCLLFISAGAEDIEAAWCIPSCHTN